MSSRASSPGHHPSFGALGPWFPQFAPPPASSEDRKASGWSMSVGSYLRGSSSPSRNQEQESLGVGARHGMIWNYRAADSRNTHGCTWFAGLLRNAPGRRLQMHAAGHFFSVKSKTLNVFLTGFVHVCPFQDARSPWHRDMSHAFDPSWGDSDTGPRNSFRGLCSWGLPETQTFHILLV